MPEHRFAKVVLHILTDAPRQIDKDEDEGGKEKPNPRVLPANLPETLIVLRDNRFINDLLVEIVEVALYKSDNTNRHHKQDNFLPVWAEQTHDSHERAAIKGSIEFFFLKIVIRHLQSPVL